MKSPAKQKVWHSAARCNLRPGRRKFIKSGVLPRCAGCVAVVEAQQPARRGPFSRSLQPTVAAAFPSVRRRIEKVTIVSECLAASEPALTDHGVDVAIDHNEPDIYKYNFTVDGVDNLDQRDPVMKYNSRPI